MFAQTRFYSIHFSNEKVFLAAIFPTAIFVRSQVLSWAYTRLTSGKLIKRTVFSHRQHMNVDRDITLYKCLQICTTLKFYFPLLMITFYFINKKLFYFAKWLETMHNTLRVFSCSCTPLPKSLVSSITRNINLCIAASLKLQFKTLWQVSREMHISLFSKPRFNV